MSQIILDSGARRPDAAIVDRIRELIADGELPLGARLSDKQLASDLAVSRTPVREALLRLRSEGLVQTKARSGTFVFSPDAHDISALCDARAVLERGAVHMLGAAGDLAPLHRLVGKAALTFERGDLAACDRLDWRFHEALVAAAANPYLTDAYQGLAAKMRALRQHMPQDVARVEAAIHDHRRLLDLIGDGQSAEATALLAAHVENVKAMLLERFGFGDG